MAKVDRPMVDRLDSSRRDLGVQRPEHPRGKGQGGHQVASGRCQVPKPGNTWALGFDMSDFFEPRGMWRGGGILPGRGGPLRPSSQALGSGEF